MRRFFFLLFLLIGCAEEPKENATTTAPVLDEASYGALVHPVVERACGTAACHGRVERGLRVYGTDLRLADRPADIRATYESILGLEPERLQEFMTRRDTDSARKLLLLAKPLTLERHRGEVSLRKGEPAEQCILSWLLGATDAAACAR